MGLDSFTPSGETQKTLLDQLGSQVRESGDSHGDFWIQISGENLHSVVGTLRSHAELAFDHFVDLCGVDYFERSPRFEVVIHLYSTEKRHRIRIRCLVPDEECTVPSLTKFWKGANWQEREAFDMYGIRFAGHPGLKRILSAPDVTDFPQRKDYPLRGAREEIEDL